MILGTHEDHPDDPLQEGHQETDEARQGSSKSGRCD